MESLTLIRSVIVRFAEAISRGEGTLFEVPNRDSLGIYYLEIGATPRRLL